MSIIAFSQNGKFITKTSLATAASDSDCAGKTIVVTSPQVITTAIVWPTDRELKFEKGGYLTFTGSGAITGLTEVQPEWFGLNTTPGTTDMTTAVQAAINTKANVKFNATTYLVGTLSIPETDNNGAIICGAGIGKTILKSNAANTVMFQKAAGAGRSMNYVFSDFSVKAHASGSTGAAFSLSGFNVCAFQRISYQSNSGGNYAKMFLLSSYPYGCYGNSFQEIMVDSQTGPSRVWSFENGGHGVNSNANVNSIGQAWIYNNTGIDVIVAGQYSLKTVVRDCEFEANTNTTVIQSGESMTIQDNYFEGNITNGNITYGVDPTNGSSLSGLVIGNFFREVQTVDFPSSVYGNVWLQNTNQINTTFTGDSRNRKLSLEYLQTGEDLVLPAITRVGGQTGSGGTMVKTVVSNPDLLGDFVGLIRLPWTPSGTGTTTFDIATISGCSLINVSFGVTDSVTGSPCVAGLQASQPAGRVVTTFATTNVHNVDAWVTYRRNQ